MRLTRWPYFLTLVLVVVSVNLLWAPDTAAAPSTEIRPDPIPVFDNRESAQLLPSLKISDGSTNVGLGSLSGVINKDKETENVTLIQLQRTQYHFESATFNSQAQEFGMSFMSNGLFGINGGFKWLPSWNFYGEPWSKVGLWGIFDPRAQLGNFIDYERYWLFGSFGFENLLHQRRQFRVEAGAAAGALGSFVFAQLIYAYPD